MKTYRYLDFIIALFAVALVISNLLSAKIIAISNLLVFDAGTLMFPLTYIFADILTEVYGYKVSRRAIWIGFFGLMLYSLSTALVAMLHTPNDPELFKQGLYWDNALQSAPRIVLASLMAYLCGEFINSFTLAKLKVKNKGRFLGFRLFISTVFGQFFDTIIFATVAFWGTMSFTIWWQLVASNYVFKLSIEFIFLPLTIFLIKKIKTVEKIDHYDYKTKFSPFSLK